MNRQRLDEQTWSTTGVTVAKKAYGKVAEIVADLNNWENLPVELQSQLSDLMADLLKIWGQELAETRVETEVARKRIVEILEKDGRDQLTLEEIANSEQEKLERGQTKESVVETKPLPESKTRALTSNDLELLLEEWEKSQLATGKTSGERRKLVEQWVGKLREQQRQLGQVSENELVGAIERQIELAVEIAPEVRKKLGAEASSEKVNQLAARQAEISQKVEIDLKNRGVEKAKAEEVAGTIAAATVEGQIKGESIRETRERVINLAEGRISQPLKEMVGRRAGGERAKDEVAKIVEETQSSVLEALRKAETESTEKYLSREPKSTQNNEEKLGGVDQVINRFREKAQAMAAGRITGVEDKQNPSDLKLSEQLNKAGVDEAEARLLAKQADLEVKEQLARQAEVARLYQAENVAAQVEAELLRQTQFGLAETRVIEEYVEVFRNVLGQESGWEGREETIIREAARELEWDQEKLVNGGQTALENNLEQLEAWWKIALRPKEEKEALIAARNAADIVLGLEKYKLGNLQAQAVDDVLRRMGENPRLLEASEWIRRKFEFFEGVDGWQQKLFTRILGSEQAKAFIERFGTEWVSKALGTISEQGFQKGLESVVGQIAQKGFGQIMIKVGTKLGADFIVKAGVSLAGGAATGGIGWVVTAALMLAQWAQGAVRNWGDRLRNKLDELLYSLGINARALDLFSGIKRWMREHLPGFISKAGEAGLTFAQGLIMIIGSLIGWLVIKEIAWIVGGIMIGMFLFQTLLMNPLVSSQMPQWNQPLGMGSEGETELVEGGSPGDDIKPEGPNTNPKPAVVKPQRVILPTRDPNLPLKPGCPAGWPVKGGSVSQGVGANWSHRDYKTGGPLNAIDIAVGQVPVYATFSGQACASPNAGAWGNLVMIYGQGCLRPDNQFKAYFAHLKTINGTGCWMVNAGDVIGIVDTTGNSEGNHLHYELRGAGDIRNYLGLDQDQYDRLGGCVSQNYCQVNLPK
jgi:hypothetical protein